MSEDLSRVAVLFLHLIGPGLLLCLGVGIFTGRHRPFRGGLRWIGLRLIICILAAPILTLGTYIVMGAVMTGFFPGRDGDGSLFYSGRIVMLALSVWFVPILILLAAAVVVLRSWATDWQWLRWIVPIAAVVLVLRFSPSLVWTLNERYGYGIAHRLHFCGMIDGARVLAPDLRMARDLTLEGLSGPHGIPPLDPTACRSLQLLPARRPVVVPDATPSWPPAVIGNTFDEEYHLSFDELVWYAPLIAEVEIEDIRPVRHNTASGELQLSEGFRCQGSTSFPASRSPTAPNGDPGWRRTIPSRAVLAGGRQ